MTTFEIRLNDMARPCAVNTVCRNTAKVQDVEEKKESYVMIKTYVNGSILFLASRLQGATSRLGGIPSRLLGHRGRRLPLQDDLEECCYLHSGIWAIILPFLFT